MTQGSGSRWSLKVEKNSGWILKNGNDITEVEKRETANECVREANYGAIQFSPSLLQHDQNFILVPLIKMTNEG